MDATHFGTVAKLFAARRSRRQALVQGGAGLAAGALAAAGLSHRAPAQAAAQDATPAADATGEKVAYLFVQSFQSGTIAPKAGEDGTYTVTLAQGLGQTVYFSDRPERIVGATSTPQFLDGLGFNADNPPNAALVVEANPGEEDIAVLELFNPTYDESTHTATYDVTVLAEWEDALGMGFSEAPTDLVALGSSFGAAHLFIDDCADLTMCQDPIGVGVGDLPGGPIGQCWSWGGSGCQPDNPNCPGPSRATLNQACNQTYGAGACGDPPACSAY